ncbi:MAG TPA: hypothetical protein VFF27_04345 [Bacteroidia bacterium]|jgi:hypothetical protein|nr:hypothetical protein [Bacteroidia bacterium]
MKKIILTSLSIAFLFTFSSCELVGGIFKAGVWSGVLLVVGIIALIIYLLSRGRRNN